MAVVGEELGRIGDIPQYGSSLIEKLPQVIRIQTPPSVESLAYIKLQLGDGLVDDPKILSLSSLGT
jgi:hypothetical protein